MSQAAEVHRSPPRSAGPQLRIRLCGDFAVEAGGRDLIADLPARQVRLLIAYLVVRRGRAVRRDELIDLVWQGAPPSAPESSLSSLLTAVRRVVGREAVRGRAAITLVLPDDVWIDLEAARGLAQAAEVALAGGRPVDALEHARAGLELTSGEVLPELHGGWVELLRSEASQLRCDQLETATRAALAVGGAELPAAVRFARRIVELEPYREVGYGLLMDALARCGNVAEALLTFERVRVMLREELGVPPAPALTALHERLLGQPDAPPVRPENDPIPVLPLPDCIRRGDQRAFVGREPELRRLRAGWDQVRRGQGELVLLTGEPGIGKTRLAARFAAEVHASGGSVLHGRTDEETVVPFQPFVEALRHLVAHVDPAVLGPQIAELRPLLPELARHGDESGDPAAQPENRRYALFEAASALLDRMARRQPLLLVIEDLHWADTPTLLLLRQVVRHAEAAPLMVLATFRRPEPMSGSPLQRVLADLRRERVLESVSLGGFDDGDTAALMTALERGPADGGCAARLREYTAGNPFFIEETLRSFGDEWGEPGGRHGGPRVPESIQEMIHRRLEQLAPATLDVLTLAAVLGREFELRALERLAGSPSDDVLHSLEEATRAGLIAEHPEPVGRFSFRHALVRETVYARPATSRRARLHLRAGDALEAIRGGVEVRAAELAHHYFLARHDGGAERAVSYGLAAGHDAARAHAYEDAVGHFERVLETLDLVPGAGEGLRTELWLALGGVRWQAGEPGARTAFLAAAELARRHDDTGAVVSAALGAGGRCYAPGGDTDPAYVELLQQALGATGPAEDGVRALLLGRLAESMDDGPPRAETSRMALHLARRAGDDATLAATLISRHAARLHPRHLDERLRLAGEAVALADGLGLRETAALARHWLIYDLVEHGDVDGARARHEELERLALALQQPLYKHSALVWRGVWAQLAGRCEEAERLAREGFRLAERAGARDARAHFTAQLLPILREQERLPELLGELRRLAADGSQVLPWRAIVPLAHLEAEEPDYASEAFAAIAAADFAIVPDGFAWLPATAWLAEAAARLNDTGACATLLARLEPYGGRLVQASFTGCWGAVDRLLGVLAAVAGRPEEADDHLRAALEQHERIGAAALAARTRSDRARLLDARPRRPAVPSARPR